MIRKIPGIQKLTISFWQAYSRIAITWLFIIIAIGSFSIMMTVVFAPEASLFIVLSILGVITHFAAFMLRDLWTGKIVKKEIESVRNLPLVDQLVIFGGFWIYINTILLGGVASAMFASTIVQSGMLALLLAIYTPVGDFYLVRKTGWSVGSGIVILFLKILLLLGVVKTISIQHLPLIGRKNRPKNFA